MVPTVNNSVGEGLVVPHHMAHLPTLDYTAPYGSINYLTGKIPRSRAIRIENNGSRSPRYGGKGRQGGTKQKHGA